MTNEQQQLLLSLQPMLLPSWDVPSITGFSSFPMLQTCQHGHASPRQRHPSSSLNTGSTCSSCYFSSLARELVTHVTCCHALHPSYSSKSTHVKHLVVGYKKPSNPMRGELAIGLAEKEIKKGWQVSAKKKKETATRERKKKAKWHLKSLASRQREGFLLAVGWTGVKQKSVKEMKLVFGL